MTASPQRPTSSNERAMLITFGVVLALAPVALLSTSPKREDTILVHDPFVD